MGSSPISRSNLIFGPDAGFSDFPLWTDRSKIRERGA